MLSKKHKMSNENGINVILYRMQHKTLFFTSYLVQLN